MLTTGHTNSPVDRTTWSSLGTAGMQPYNFMARIITGDTVQQLAGNFFTCAKWSVCKRFGNAGAPEAEMPDRAGIPGCT